MKGYKGGGVAVFKTIKGTPHVLLGKRAYNPGRNTWTFVGGGANFGERLESTAYREFKEETKNRIYKKYVLRKGEYHLKNIFFEWKTILIETTQDFKFYRDEKTKLYGGEFLDLKFFPIDKIPLNVYLWVRPVIKQYKNNGLKKYTYEPSKKTLRTPKPLYKAKSQNTVCNNSIANKKGYKPFKQSDYKFIRKDKDGTLIYILR